MDGDSQAFVNDKKVKDLDFADLLPQVTTDYFQYFYEIQYTMNNIQR